VNGTIDVSKTGAPILKNIYGPFLEHGGDIVNTEMLVDRKFLNPVATSAPTPPPMMGQCRRQSAIQSEGRGRKILMI
jgi:alpha-L-arabinofuranosidase